MINTLNKISIIEVGTHIYSKLYGGRHGIVCAVHGKSDPNGVRQLVGGFISTGGGAEYDVVFKNGTLTHKIPECIIRGVQWVIYDEDPLASQEQINAALANSELVQAKAKADKDAAAAALKANTEKLKTENPLGLDVVDKHAGATAVAKNIRKVLKHFWPKVKFSVKKSSYDCINVRWTDGPTSSEVDQEIKGFKSGYYDSMQDMHEYVDTPFNLAFGSVQYLFTNRDNSDESTQRAIDALWDTIPENLEGIEKPTPDNCFKELVRVESLAMTLSEAIRDLEFYYSHTSNKYVTDNGYVRPVVSMVINHILRQEFISLPIVQNLSLSDAEMHQLFWKASDLVKYQSMTIEQAAIQLIAA